MYREAQTNSETRAEPGLAFAGFDFVHVDAEQSMVA